MVLSTIDRLRERLAIPSPVRPVEPSYPAPIAPGPRVFVPPVVDGAGLCNETDHSTPVHMLTLLNVRSRGQYERHEPERILSLIPTPPDIPAPVLHAHSYSAHRARASPLKQGDYGRQTVEGLDKYSEMRAWGNGTAGSCKPLLEHVQNPDCQGQEQRFYDEYKGSTFDMEQQLEMVAMSLRGDQDEVAGVRRGLMMLQPFEGDVQNNGDQEQIAHEYLRQATKIESKGSPDDYLRQITEIESKVLKPDQLSSTWTAAQYTTAVCVCPWTATKKGELSLELNDTLDVSFLDSSDIVQDWWFAIKADKPHQSGSRTKIWRFPQDLGLLRQQSGYFPSKCVLIDTPQVPTTMPCNLNSPKQENKPPIRHQNLKQTSAGSVPEFSFPILQRDPTADPPLIPFADVPLWLPTWNKFSPRDKTFPVDKNFPVLDNVSPRDRTGHVRRGSEDFSSLPQLTSDADSQSDDTTFTASFTAVPSSGNFYANVINDSDVDSPSSSRPPSARSVNSPRSGNTLSLQHFHQDLRSFNSPQSGNALSLPHFQQVTPQSITTQTFGSTPQAEFRTVQIMRDPNAPPSGQSGIGLQYARPRNEMGAVHILALSTEGTALKSGRVKVGDLIHEVDGKNIHFLSPQEITQLIQGPPSTFVTLLLSDRSPTSSQIMESSAVGRPLGSFSSASSAAERARPAALDATETTLSIPGLDQPARSVDMTIRLGLDFKIVGKELSEERKKFVLDLSQDLAIASGLEPANFYIKKLSPGSILVDTEIRIDWSCSATDPDTVARDLERQAHDPRSRIRSGVITRFIEEIVLRSQSPSSTEMEAVHVPGTVGAFFHKSHPKSPPVSSNKHARSESETPLAVPNLNFPLVGSSIGTSATQPQMRTVNITRGNGVPPQGIGIQFGRPQFGRPPDNLTDDYIIYNINADGPAGQSGLLKVGDHLHAVDGTNITHLTVQEISALIRGPPVTTVSLTISTPPMGFNSTPVKLDLYGIPTRESTRRKTQQYAADTSLASSIPNSLQDLQAQPEQRSYSSLPLRRPQLQSCTPSLQSAGSGGVGAVQPRLPSPTKQPDSSAPINFLSSGTANDIGRGRGETGVEVAHRPAVDPSLFGQPPNDTGSPSSFGGYTTAEPRGTSPVSMPMATSWKGPNKRDDLLDGPISNSRSDFFKEYAGI